MLDFNNNNNNMEVENMLKIIENKNAEIAALKEQLSQQRPATVVEDVTEDHEIRKTETAKLMNAQISRYSRQLILPEIGVKGQLSLANKSVLIVGAGGLGCPAAIYLTAAGIGTLGIVDYDEVEISNLHRQILHRESRVGVCKSVSATTACQELNSGVKFVPYHLQLDSLNALHIIQQYDIVLDATDNVATRYLLNDACVLAGKPLISGSALRFEGQLTVYNHGGGPCYRCLFPKPPPPETVTNCSDGGVLGVIPGIIGCLQALEAIKLAAGLDTSYGQKLLMFDGLDGMFRTVRLRRRQKDCPVCGDTPTITQLIDYEQFCGAKASDKDKEHKILEKQQRITAKKFKTMVDDKEPHVLVDVRLPVEMDICQLPTEFINIPLRQIDKDRAVEEIRSKVMGLSNQGDNNHVPVICVCRKGNDSQMAVQKLQERLKCDGIPVQDIAGGLTAWTRNVDPDFPAY